MVVEKRKTRKLVSPGGEPEKVVPEAAVAAPSPRPGVGARPTAQPSARPAGPDASRGAAVRNLSDAERDARAMALAAARERAVDDERTRVEVAEKDAERRAAVEAERAANPPVAEASAPTAEQPAPVPAVKSTEPAPAQVAASAPQPRSAQPSASPVAPSPRAPAGAPYAPAARSGPAPSRDARPVSARPQQSNNTAWMPREGGRPQEIRLPGPARPRPGAAAAPPDPATEVTKPMRAARPLVTTQQPDDDEGRGGLKRGGSRSPARRSRPPTSAASASS